jgi:glycogen synthase
MPIQSTFPTWGKSVGGVSERAGVKAGGSNPFAYIPSRVVAVKGILVVWKVVLFAGHHRNEGLGRSVV